MPPRSITAFPLLTQMAAASAVTFGRDSYTKKTTPKGTRTRLTRRPLGRTAGINHLANRISQRGNVLHAGGDGVDTTLRVEPQAIGLRVGQTVTREPPR